MSTWYSYSIYITRDDLLEESKIWEYSVQWGKAKPNLPTDHDKWTNDNFLSLGNFERYIKLICRSTYVITFM
ncbi:hypothetical protein Glove_227g115 [Diversispora epigaea]|uniref:Uncharacterized protein n=1 Tax=Diversispora epigaea TaxID=1348612 RepID=A0A397IE26_9GLOM|nr:hypothetical protein Glove_227g115 [Diversispora epigaea]